MKISMNSIAANKRGLLLGLGLGFVAIAAIRAFRARRASAKLRPVEDHGEGLRLDEGVDLEATERAVRSVGLATWT